MKISSFVVGFLLTGLLGVAVSDQNQVNFAYFHANNLSERVLIGQDMDDSDQQDSAMPSDNDESADNQDDQSTGDDENNSDVTTQGDDAQGDESASSDEDLSYYD